MSQHKLPETCHFGHVFEVYDRDGTGEPGAGGEFGAELRKKIVEGKLRSFEEYEQEAGTEKLLPLLGDAYKTLKVSANSQGTPFTVSWTCADKLDEDLNYTVEKVSEDIFVAPQNQLHQEFMQRKQQAEQRVNQTLSSLSDLRKTKHMLEHDIRKLRSRAESFGTRDETQLKADFVELVDGAGGGAQQGADEASLKTLRDQNLYPSIVADFFEMEGLDDLKKADQLESKHDGKLARLPANEKAILKKKWVMYEKWKDLYGSEVQRKLQELKGQLKNVERSIDETERWLQPYVRDVVMINQESPDTLADNMTFYPAIRGTATMRRDVSFIAYRPLKNTGDNLQVVDDESEATHYRIIHVYSVHVNIAGGEQPNSPAGGPSSAKIFYRPSIVCRHVFENFFEAKIDKQKNRFRNLLRDYVGDLDDTKGKKIKQAREKKNWSVRKLRQEIGEDVGEQAPLELSSYIRRVEDGLDDPGVIAEEFGEDYLTAMEELLAIDFHGERHEDEMYHGISKTLRKFTGQTDPYVIPDTEDPLFDLLMEMKFKYYYDYKLALGLYTMK